MSSLAFSAGFGAFHPLGNTPAAQPVRATKRSGKQLRGLQAMAGASAGSLAAPERSAPAGRDVDMDLSDRTDEALMAAYLAGDRRAFVELLERYRVELHQFLARFLGSTAAADDVFQETFLQVHIAGHSFDQARSFKPWLFTIAANKARDWHRRQKRRSTISLDTPVGTGSDGVKLVDLMEGAAAEPDQPLQADELRRRVSAVVDALPAHYREILLLSYFQRMSYNQVAQVLNIPLGTVKSRLHAAVAAFADRWSTSKERRS